MWPNAAPAAEKKVKRPPAAKSTPTPSSLSVNDANLTDKFKQGEELAKEGRGNEALPIFQGIYDYTRDGLNLMKCVKVAYGKAIAGKNLEQEQREDLYLKLQRINSLTTNYSTLRAESAFELGVLHARRGNAEQARKYLLETCQTVPFSLDPASTWMRAKTLLLTLSNLEGEF